MDKKKKIRVVVIVPVIVTVIIACAVIYFVLQAASSSGGSTYNAHLAETTDPAHMIVASSEGEAAPATDEPVAPLAVEGSADCGFQEWVGNPLDIEAVKATGRPFRVLKPDSMTTMDYSPERINVVTDDDGKVLAVRCG